MKRVTRAEVNYIRDLPSTNGTFRRITSEGVSYCAAGKLALLMSNWHFAQLPPTFTHKLSLAGVIEANDVHKHYDRAFDLALATALNEGWIEIIESSVISPERQKELAYV